VEDLVEEHGPMQPEEISGKLASGGMAVAVINPESLEEYERDSGEVVGIVRGGSHRALSAAAVDRRLGKMHSGFKRRPDGAWELEEPPGERVKRLAAVGGGA